MSDLANEVKTVFEARFSTGPDVVVQAPGRVNIIGEHTDYNDGYVLPCAINFQTIVAASKRSDSVVKVIAMDYQNDIDEFDINKDIVASEKTWANYIRGVISHLIKRGHDFSGANLVVSGNVPQGAGLSSSASLEVAIGQTIKELYNIDISQQELALNAQESENQFVGCQCGIMDQLISAKALHNHALLIDCRTLESTPVSLPEGHSIIIVNSNKQRGLVDSEYNERRKQCQQAADFFGVKALRDVSLQTFNEKQSSLSPLIAKRARHIITENDRTLLAAKAMNNNDIHTLQRLMTESHESMKSDFEITVREVDILVDTIKNAIGENGGVRMTGGGFGGCVVCIAPTHLVDRVSQAVNDRYTDLTGLHASIFVYTAETGASLLN